MYHIKIFKVWDGTRKGSSETEQKKLSNAEKNCPAETTRGNEQLSTDLYDSVSLTDRYVMGSRERRKWRLSYITADIIIEKPPNLRKTLINIFKNLNKFLRGKSSETLTTYSNYWWSQWENRGNPGGNVMYKV